MGLCIHELMFKIHSEYLYHPLPHRTPSYHKLRLYFLRPTLYASVIVVFFNNRLRNIGVRCAPTTGAIHWGLLHVMCNSPQINSHFLSSPLIRSTASIVFSLLPKAVRRKKPSPFLPKPAPGVPTTFTLLSR